jgi:hypothetical protein
MDLWLSCWFGGFIVFSIMFWAMSFLPLSRRLWLHKDSLRAGRPTIRFSRVKSVSWEDRGEFWVLIFELQSGTRKEFGVPLDIQPKIAAALESIKPLS